MGGFLGLLGWLLWGGYGIVVLLIMGATGLLLNPAVSPRLAMRLYGAMRLGPHQAPVLWTVVARLAERAGLPARPELYYVWRTCSAAPPACCRCWDSSCSS